MRRGGRRELDLRAGQDQDQEREREQEPEPRRSGSSGSPREACWI